MLSDKIQIFPRRRLSDERGWFVKPIEGNEEGLPSDKCEIYVTAAAPGQSKGGDYSKSTNKWFAIVKGQAVLKLEDIETKEQLTVSLDSNNPKTIYVPHMIANVFINDGQEELILVVYADNQYDNNDIIPYKL